MSEKDNDQPELLEKLFSTQVILTAILILGIYWVFFGEDKSRDSSVSRYTSQNIPIGISNQLNPEAIKKFSVLTNPFVVKCFVKKFLNTMCVRHV